MLRILILCVSGWFVGSASGLTQSFTPAEIAAKARPAVVLVKAKASGQEIAQGSGFIVDGSGLLVTNLHVVEGADAISVQFASGEVYDNIYFVSSDRRKDIAILKVPATGLSFLRFGDDQAISVGDRIYVMGNPLGLEGTFSDGLVSAKRIDDGVAYLQISAPVSSGSSGGPVLNSRGEAIGIATAVMRDGQNLNMAVVTRYAQGLLSMNERPRTLREAREELGPAPGAARTPAATTAGAGASGTTLKPWEEIVLEQIKIVDKTYEEEGYRPSHELHTGYMAVGSKTTKVDLDPGRYVFVGVCDGDCDDLDLLVLQGTRTVASDVDSDDYPEVHVNVTRGGEFSLTVRMVSCSDAPCHYAVRVLRSR